ncbi:DUF1003 domain-containing protein [soil metagenome]
MPKALRNRRVLASPVTSNYHDASSSEELTDRNIRAMLQLENAAKANRCRSDIVADAVAQFCGTMTFVWVHVVLFTAWILLNTLPEVRHVDPFPFTFLTLMVSLEAIFLSAFILVSQNLETRATERRNQLDLQINLLTEQENTKILQMLEKISTKLGIDMSDEDPSLQMLEKATRPDQLVDQIERARTQGLAEAAQRRHERT